MLQNRLHLQFQKKQTTELDSIQPHTIIEDISVAQTSLVDALPATHIHPCEGPPAKEPEYPPGTYHGMF